MEQKSQGEGKRFKTTALENPTQKKSRITEEQGGPVTLGWGRLGSRALSPDTGSPVAGGDRDRCGRRSGRYAACENVPRDPRQES